MDKEWRKRKAQSEQSEAGTSKQAEKRSDEVVGRVLKRKYKGTGKVTNKEHH